MCEKRPFGSKHAAHAAMQTMGQSVRVYICHDCGKYHVTKSRYTKQVKPKRREKNV